MPVAAIIDLRVLDLVCWWVCCCPSYTHDVLDKTGKNGPEFVHCKSGCFNRKTVGVVEAYGDVDWLCD